MSDKPTIDEIQTESLRFSFFDKEYEYDISEASESELAALNYMRGLYLEESQLEELTTEELDATIVALMRYQGRNYKRFKDAEEDEGYYRIERNFLSNEQPVISTTEFTDSAGNIYSAEVLGDPADYPALRKKASENQRFTHHGMIRNALAAMMQHRIDPMQNWQDAQKSMHEKLPPEEFMEWFDKHYDDFIVETKLLIALSKVYREQANTEEVLTEQELPMWMRDTHRFDAMESHPQGVLIGEKHIRLVRNENYENLLERLIDNLGPDATVFIEAFDEPDNLKGEVVGYATFQQLAYTYARSKRLEIVHLDDKDYNENIPTDEVIGMLIESGFSKEEAVFMCFFKKVWLRFELDSISRYGTYESQRSLLAIILKEEAESTVFEEYVELVKEYSDQIISESFYVEELRSFWFFLLRQIDTPVREKLWYRKIAKVKEKKPNKRVLIISGAAHLGSLRKMLDSTGGGQIENLDHSIIDRFREWREGLMPSHHH